MSRDPWQGLRHEVWKLLEVINKIDIPPKKIKEITNFLGNTPDLRDAIAYVYKSECTDKTELLRFLDRNPPKKTMEQESREWRLDAIARKREHVRAERQQQRDERKIKRRKCLNDLLVEPGYHFEVPTIVFERDPVGREIVNEALNGYAYRDRYQHGVMASARG